MSEATYNAYERARAHAHGQRTWYSQNMTKEAAVYILAWANIEAGRIKVSKNVVEDAKTGRIWSETEKKIEIERETKEACDAWEYKLPKLASVLNPANGADFFPLCKTISRRLQRSQDKKKGDKGLGLGLERVRIFSGAYLSAKYRCKLLDVHYGPEEEKKKYHHPHSNSETAIRAWLQTWSMWCFIEHVGMFIIEQFCEEAFDKGRHVHFIGGKAEFVKLHTKLYSSYVENLAREFGGRLWNRDPLKMDGLRKIWKARTKRCVTRFFFHQEELRASKFDVFPEVISSWMLLRKSSTSMYPGDGIPPADTILTSFEIACCPWYIEYNGWDTTHSLSERNYQAKCREGVTPTLPYNVGKLLPPNEDEAKEFEVKIPLDPQYDGKASRFEVQKVKKETPTQSQGSVQGPLFTPDTEGNGQSSQSPATATPASPTNGPTPPAMSQPLGPLRTPATPGRGNTLLSLYFGNCEYPFSASLAEMGCGWPC